MERKDPLARFATEHAIDLRNLLDAERDEVRWMVRSTDVLDRAYGSLPDQVLASDPAVGVLWHLLARSAEMAAGAVVAFAAESGSAAEVLSRAAIERAVSICFIVQNPRPRLAAYFRHHVDDVDRQIAQWKRVAMSMTDDGRQVHLDACDHRVTANRQMRSLVDRLETEMIGSNPREKWPSKITERFEGLQDSITYRTMYARLCSETHFDAEETLRYIVGKLAGDVLMRRMALETIGFTRLAVGMGVGYHLRAVLAYADRYDMAEVVRECGEGVASIDRWVEELSRHVGGIPTAG